MRRIKCETGWENVRTKTRARKWRKKKDTSRERNIYGEQKRTLGLLDEAVNLAGIIGNDDSVLAGVLDASDHDGSLLSVMVVELEHFLGEKKGGRNKSCGEDGMSAKNNPRNTKREPTTANKTTRETPT